MNNKMETYIPKPPVRHRLRPVSPPSLRAQPAQCARGRHSLGARLLRVRRHHTSYEETFPIQGNPTRRSVLQSQGEDGNEVVFTSPALQRACSGKRNRTKGPRPLKLGALNRSPSESEDTGPPASWGDQDQPGRPGVWRRHHHLQPAAGPRDEASPQAGLAQGHLRSPSCSPRPLHAARCPWDCPPSIADVCPCSSVSGQRAQVQTPALGMQHPHALCTLWGSLPSVSPTLCGRRKVTWEF